MRPRRRVRLRTQRPRLSGAREARFILIVGLTAIGLTVASAFAASEGRVAAAFSQTVSYAMSFFAPDTLGPYDASQTTPMISIHIDPQTGESQVASEQSPAAPAPLRLEAIGAATQDAAARGTSAPRPAPSTAPSALPSASPRSP